MEVFACPSHAFGQLDPTTSATDTDMDIDMDIDLGSIGVDEPVQSVGRLHSLNFLEYIANALIVRNPNFRRKWHGRVKLQTPRPRA